jgi:hypothetical protein
MRFPTANPYDFSHPVKDPLLFAGRREQRTDAAYYLEQARSLTQPMSLAVIGPRASGKTSFLNLVEAMAIDKGFLVVRVDLDDADVTSPLTFCHRLIDELLAAALTSGSFGGENGELAQTVMALSAGELPVTPGGSPLRVHRAWAVALSATTTDLPVSSSMMLADLTRIRDEVGRPIVLMIDEADTIANRPALLQKLRNVFQRADGYLVVIAGTERLFPDLDRVYSPVARQFKTIIIGAFDDAEETADCVVNALRKAGLDPARVMSPETYERLPEIHDIARGRPYEVKLLCHFMFRRAQEGTSNGMELDLPVLEDVRGELEREGSMAGRSILATIRGLDKDALTNLAALVDADGNATLDQLWQVEYAFHGISRFSERGLAEACASLVEKGVLRLDGNLVKFCGDEFDRLYCTYFARERGVALGFPPLGSFALDVYWRVSLQGWLREKRLMSVGPMRSGEGRRDLDNVALYSILGSLSGVADDLSAVEQNAVLAIDLHELMQQMRRGSEVRMSRIRLTLGSVDLTGLFTGPAMIRDARREEFLTEFHLVETRVGELGGTLELEMFMLAIYDFDRIAQTVELRGGEAFRRTLANLHASKARRLYSDPERRTDARVHAMLSYRYGADVWPALASDLGYMLLTGGELDAAYDLLRRAVRDTDGMQQAAALASLNLGVVFAQRGELDLAVEQFDRGMELVTGMDEEDRQMLCLLVGRTVDGRLVFAEEDGPDLSVAISETRSAVEEARQRLIGHE